MISTDYAYNHSWEELFEQATEDVSMFTTAAEDWPESSDGYPLDYLLIILLSCRTRTERALDRMASSGLSDEYLPYRKRIEKLFLKGEGILKAILHSDAVLIGNIINKDFIERTDRLFNSLVRIRGLVQQGYLMEDTEWVEDDLRETTHDFLIDYQELSLCRKELTSPIFKQALNAGLFVDRMASLEKKFRSYFGYFRIIEEIIASVRDREYSPEDWWFTQMPGENTVSETGISDELTEKLFRAYKESPDVSGKCPSHEEIIASAFDELPTENNRWIRDHLSECRNCLDLVMDLREADKDTQDKEEPVVIPDVMKAIREASGIGDNIRESGFKIKQQETLTDSVAPESLFIKQKAQEIIESVFSATLELFRLEPELVATRSGSAHKEMLVKNGSVLHSGDQFKIKFKSEQDCYVYILLKDSAGEVVKLFEGKIVSQEITKLGPFQLDDNTGEESIIMLTSAFSIENLDERIEQIKITCQTNAEMETMFSDIDVNTISFLHE